MTVPPHEVEAGRAHRLTVGLIALLALGVNGIVGVGIVFAPAEVVARSGGTGVAVFAATALALVPVALAFAVLGRRFDEDGGPVTFARAAFGGLPAFVVGWIAYASALASSAAVTVGLTSAAGPLVGIRGEGAQRAAATLLAALMAAICFSGLRLSAHTWTALTAAKLVPLLALVTAWLVAGAPLAAAATTAAPMGGAGMAAAALLVTFTYQGFEIVPVLAGEAKRPAVSVPLATVGSLAIAACLYVALQAACAAALPGLATSSAPLVDAAAALGGPALAALVGAGTSLSALGICFGMMAATPFYLAALARGEPRTLGLDAIDARGVARRALAVTWLAVTILVQLGTRGELFALSSVAVLSQFVVTAAALGALAWRRERGLLRWHLALALPAALVALTLVGAASKREALVAVAVLLGGLIGRTIVRAWR